MKHPYSSFFLCSIFFFLFSTPSTFGQYLESFPIANRGLLAGPCGATSATCASNNFTGVNWTINGDFSGFDSNDIMATDGTGELFVGGDIDGELCFESPSLNISSVASNVSLSVDLEWVNHDIGDYVDVEYMIDGGSWIQISNQFGGGTHTVEFTLNSQSGFGTVTQGGLSGSSTLSVRVCVRTNTGSSGESTTIDDVSVPEANVLVLPVELISFKAKKRKNDVLLNWITASETNNEKFEIEHSNNGRRFEKISELQGNGTIELISNYSYTHDRPSMGVNYYRLKQVDFDGRFEYSDVLSVNMETEGTYIGAFYPNPSNRGKVHLDYTALKNSTLELSIYNLSGNYISSRIIPIIKGENKLNFDLANLTKGIYLIEVKNESASVWRKLVIN